MVVLLRFYGCNNALVAFSIFSECAVVPECSNVPPVQIASGDNVCAIVKLNNSFFFCALTFYPNVTCNEHKTGQLDPLLLNVPQIKNPPVARCKHKLSLP